MNATMRERPVVEHWFDLICPFCYIAQDRNRILRARGIEVIEYGLQIHPEIGPGGVEAGPRSGPMYESLARLAAEAGLPLRWSDRISYSRPALSAHAWIAARDTDAAERFAASVFDAYFGSGQDIEDRSLILDRAARAGADASELSAAWQVAEGLLQTSEARAARNSVQATPAWVFNGQQLTGLRSREWFEAWGEALTIGAQEHHSS